MQGAWVASLGHLQFCLAICQAAGSRLSSLIAVVVTRRGLLLVDNLRRLFGRPIIVAVTLCESAHRAHCAN